MKVLQLISSSGMYGAESVILNLSSTLNDTGKHQSILGVFFNSTLPNSELQDAARRAGLEVHMILCEGQWDRACAGRIRELATRTGADVVHAHGYKADVYSWLAMRRSGVPLVSTCHNWVENNRRLRLYGALDRLVLRRFDGIIAVSDAVRERLLAARVNPEKIRMIRNGVDLRRYRTHTRPQTAACARTGLRIGFAGRLSYEKGPDVFLRAAAQVLRVRPETSFFIAGDGPERAALDRLIADLNLSNSVTMLGRCNDMREFYNSIDVMALSSRTEGLPVALLEAMASGLPVIATRVGAVPQVIRENETGLLVEPGYHTELAESMLRLLDDPALRARLGTAAQELVAREYSSERMAAEHLDFYARAAMR